MCGTKRLNQFFRLHEASEVLNKWTNGQFTIVTYLSVLSTLNKSNNK